MSVQTAIPSYAEGLQQLQNNLQQMLPAEALTVFSEDADALQTAYKSILKIKEGEQAPDFSLPNALGEMVKLSNLLKDGKVVLTFYRGSWCPYCNLQLNQYQQVLREIQEHGAQLVAVSPQTPDESLSLTEKNELQFEVLSDNGNMVARQFTTVFRYSDQPINTMTALGYDFDSYYADDSRELPIPAVFIIDQDGKVLFAQSTGGDYRNRVEASDIINALKKQALK